MFFPLLLLEGFNLKVSSVQSVIAAARGRCGARQRRMALVEMVLLTLHFAGYLALVFSVMSPGKALAFIFVHQAVLGVHLGRAYTEEGLIESYTHALGHLQDVGAPLR